jgi:hypothetical protein
MFGKNDVVKNIIIYEIFSGLLIWVAVYSILGKTAAPG